MWKLALTIGFAGLLSTGSAAEPTAGGERKVTTTTIIDKTNFKVRDGTLTVSADGQRIAWAREVDDGWAVELDGKVQATHEQVGPLKAGQAGEASVEFPGFRPMVFSADSQHLAYSGHDEGSWFVIHDGRKGKPYENVGGPVLSRDGGHLAYAADNDEGWCVVSDGVEGKTYEKVGPPAISPDGKHVAYVARVGGKERMVVDGVEGKPYDRISIIPKLMAMFFNPHMVVAWPLFSLDGRVAYPAKNAGGWYMVVDGQEGEVFEDVHDPTFSPDGKRLAYPAKKKGSKWSVVIDGQALGSFDETSKAFTSDSTVRPVVFSPDGRHYAAAVKVSGKWSVFVDGAMSGKETYDETELPVFSPDGNRLAYVAKKGKQWVAVTDGVAQKPYVAVRQPVFSPDGSHVAYAAAYSQGTWVVVVDGVEGKVNHGLGSVVVFDDNTHLHYLAMVGQQLLLFREELPSGSQPPAVEAPPVNP
jgi:hypothetical protein